MRPRIRLREVLLLATLGAMVFGYCSVVIRGWSTAIVSHLEFSPDGRKLAAVFNRGKVEIWDLSDARPRRAAETQLAPRFDLWPPVCWARVGDQEEIVYAIERADGTRTQLKRWNPATDRHINVVEVAGRVSGKSGFVARAGKLIFHLQGSTDGYFSVVLTSGVLNRLQIGGERLLDVSPNGDYFAMDAGGPSVMPARGGSILAWDRDGVGVARFSADGQIVLFRACQGGSSAWDGDRGPFFVRAYKPSGGNRLWQIETERFGVWWREAPSDVLRLTPDEKQLVVVRTQDIDVFDVATGERVSTVDLRGRWRYQSSWSRWWLRRPWLTLGILAHHDWISTRDALSPDARFHARAHRHAPLTVCEIARRKCQVLSDDLRRWLAAAAFAVGFVTWGGVWGLARRGNVSRGWSFAGIVMILSGIFLIARGVAIGFQCPQDFGGSDFLGSSLPCLGMGVYSVANGAELHERKVGRVALAQLLGILVCDVWLSVSAVPLFLLSLARWRTRKSRGTVYRGV